MRIISSLKRISETNSSSRCRWDKNLAVFSVVISEKKKRSSRSVAMENPSIKSQNCMATLTLIASIVFGSVVQQGWPLLV